MKSQSVIRQQLNKLKEKDIYSLLLFTLFNLKNVEEYSTLSELIYVLNKEDFLNFCRVFGGTTITVPTVDELIYLLDALILYGEVNIKGNNLEETIKENQIDFNKEVKESYAKVCEVMGKYEFSPRNDETDA